MGTRSRSSDVKRAPIVVALANQKGGVAKTTSVASIGAALAELGQRVLLVDLDPQACLTFSLGVDPDTVERSIHDVLTGSAELGDVVVTCEEGIDLVPSAIDLAGAEAMLLPVGGGGPVARAGAGRHAAQCVRSSGQKAEIVRGARSVRVSADTTAP